MKLLPALLLVMCAAATFAQTSPQSILEWQHHYKEEFLSDPRSPLKAADTGFLRFFPYEASSAYRCKVKRIRHSDTVMMATHSGKVKKYIVYAVLKFSQRSSLEHYPAMRTNPPFRLCLYQSADASRDTAYRDYLFLPFTDYSNGETSYGGGRYLDFRIGDIKDGRLLLDFNKAYNPWCAFKEGYSCPIPPRENRIDMRILAGEMMPAPPLGKKE